VQAARLDVTAGSVVSGINAKVVPGGTVRGVVLDSATGQPVEGICLDGFTARQRDPFATSYCSLADGTFVLKGFPTTSVKVQLFDSSGTYAGEWAIGKRNRHRHPHRRRRHHPAAPDGQPPGQLTGHSLGLRTSSDLPRQLRVRGGTLACSAALEAHGAFPLRLRAAPGSAGGVTSAGRCR